MPKNFWTSCHPRYKSAVAGLAEILPQPPLTRIRSSLCRSTLRPQRTGRDFAHSEFLRDRLKKNSKQCSSIAKLKLVGCETWPSAGKEAHETAGVRLAGRQCCGCMAACGARAAV